MDLWEIVLVTIRRWKVTLPVLLACIALVGTIAVATAPTWKAEATVGFIGPGASVQTSTDGRVTLLPDQNPLGSGNTRVVAAFAESAAESPLAKQQLLDRGLAVDYTVTLDTFNPMLFVQTESDDSQTAIDATQFLVDLIDREIEEWNVDVGVETDVLRFRTLTIFIDDTARQDSSGRTKMLIIGAIATLAITLGAGVLADLVATGRDRRRKRNEPTETLPTWSSADESLPWPADERPARPSEPVAVGQPRGGADADRWGRR